jgi:hypothetical protein
MAGDWTAMEWMDFFHFRSASPSCEIPFSIAARFRAVSRTYLQGPMPEFTTSRSSSRGAAITQNGGPGMLALVNSSLDVAGSTFSSNVGGTVVCDGSSFITGDLTSGSISSCKVPAASGLQHKLNSEVDVPNWRQQKAYADRIHRLTSRLHH